MPADSALCIYATAQQCLTDIALLRPNPSRSIGIQYLIHVQLLQSLLKVLWRDTWTQI